jgi:hypothetical protein
LINTNAVKCYVLWDNASIFNQIWNFGAQLHVDIVNLHIVINQVCFNLYKIM